MYMFMYMYVYICNVLYMCSFLLYCDCITLHVYGVNRNRQFLHVIDNGHFMHVVVEKTISISYRPVIICLEPLLSGLEDRRSED